jgi:enoyl-CoA hydratase/carnithine racemase
MAQARTEITVEGGVAEVRMARPEKHNALDPAMFRALRDAQAQLREDRSVRAVVLSGEGPSFCSGLDLGAIAAGEFDPAELVDRPNDEVANLAQTAAWGWRTLPVPVVAALHGACFGGGLQIALGADLRVAAPDAKLSVMEVKLGLIPDMGIGQALPRLVRDDVARELTFSGRVFDAVEGERLGLVTRLEAVPRQAALELAAQIAAVSPDAVVAAKRLFNEGWGEPPERGLRLETELVRTLLGSPNQMEAARAAIMKETPSFADRVD